MNGFRSNKTKYELVVGIVLFVILSALIIINHRKKTSEKAVQNSSHYFSQNASQKSNANEVLNTNATPIQEPATEKIPCAEPIKYSVGGVDPRFDMNETDLKKILLEAENVWEKPSGKNLLEYSLVAAFKVNLIFDQRQQDIIEAKELEEKLANLKSFHQDIVDKYGNVKSAYKKRMDDFNDEIIDYEGRVASYNSSVEYWKEKGGAPQKTYDDLKSQKMDLEKTYNRLNKEKETINDLVSQVNNLVKSENSVISDFNQSLETYKSKFGNSTEFDKGVFDGNGINIFEFKDKNDLRLAVAHEFGHALGISHVQNSKSIMYYLMGDQDLVSPQLSFEDFSALKAVCKIK
jgi:hypothetical protein